MKSPKSRIVALSILILFICGMITDYGSFYLFRPMRHFLADPFYTFNKVENSACNQQQGENAAYYGFDEVLVYYSGFPSTEEQSAQDYPSAFKIDAFNTFVVNRLRKSLQGCLKKSLTGEEKKIILLGNIGEGLYTPEWNANRHRLHEPNNLVIVINFQILKESDLLDIPYVSKRYIYASYFKYRPSAKENAPNRPMASSISSVNFLFSESPEIWVSRLDNLLSRVGPVPPRSQDSF